MARAAAGLPLRASEPCLQRSIQSHPGQNVAVIFCRGGVIRMILAILLKLPLPKTNQFDVEYSSVTQVASCTSPYERGGTPQFHPLARSGGLTRDHHRHR